MNKTKVSELITNAQLEFQKLGLSEKALENYNVSGFTRIKKHFQEQGYEYYSKDVVWQLVVTSRKNYEQGTLSRYKYQNIRKAAALIDEFYNTGTLKWSRLPNWGTVMLGEYYKNVLSEYLDEKLISGTHAHSTNRSYRNVITLFLHYLEEAGHKDFERLTLKIMSSYIPIIAEKQPGNMKTVLSALRSFAKYLLEIELISTDLTPALQVKISKRRKLQDYLSHEEADKVISSIDVNSDLGKRDYAILSLAKYTGLRAIDIANLKFGDIDWKNDEIRIIQHKTKRSLTLPLNIGVGNSIAKYILNCRPKSDSPYIFLTATKPFRPLYHRSVSSIATRHIKRADIGKSQAHRGFHSFRRSMGTWLLEVEMPLSMIREILGHSKIDSSKPYLSTNFEGLKSCSIGLDGIEVLGGDLV